MEPILTASIYLIQTLINLYLILLLIRFIAIYNRAPRHNQINDVLCRLTDPLAKPLRHAIPTSRGVDFSILLIAVIFSMIKIIFIGLLSAGSIANITAIFIFAAANIIDLLLNILFYAILIEAILSWINTTLRNPITEFLYFITEPLLKIGRRYIPLVGGLDLSPIVIMVLLKVITILVVYPLSGIALRLA